MLAAFVLLGPFGRTVLAHGNELWKEYSYPGGMDAIAMGCLTAILISRREFSAIQLRAMTVGGIAILVCGLCFWRAIYRFGVERSGLDMTLIALGTCLVMAPAAQTGWTSPRFLRPLTSLGQRSYEVYLTHMFVVFACFNFFVARGKPMNAIPALFVVTIALAGLLGAVVARLYSEPLNARIRGQLSS